MNTIKYDHSSLSSEVSVSFDCQKENTTNMQQQHNDFDQSNESNIIQNTIRTSTIHHPSHPSNHTMMTMVMVPNDDTSRENTCCNPMAHTLWNHIVSDDDTIAVSSSNPSSTLVFLSNQNNKNVGYEIDDDEDDDQLVGNDWYLDHINHSMNDSNINYANDIYIDTTHTDTHSPDTNTAVTTIDKNNNHHKVQQQQPTTTIMEPYFVPVNRTIYDPMVMTKDCNTGNCVTKNKMMTNPSCIKEQQQYSYENHSNHHDDTTFDDDDDIYDHYHDEIGNSVCYISSSIQSSERQQQQQQNKHQRQSSSSSSLLLLSRPVAIRPNNIMSKSISF